MPRDIGESISSDHSIIGSQALIHEIFRIQIKVAKLTAGL